MRGASRPLSTPSYRPPFGSPAQTIVEQRHCEGRVFRGGPVDHAFGDKRRSPWSDGLDPHAERCRAVPRARVAAGRWRSPRCCARKTSSPPGDPGTPMDAYARPIRRTSTRSPHVHLAHHRIPSTLYLAHRRIAHARISPRNAPTLSGYTATGWTAGLEYTHVSALVISQWIGLRGLLIRWFRVRAPGGVPPLTSTFFVRERIPFLRRSAA
jgi:hypothetical protein